MRQSLDRPLSRASLIFLVAGLLSTAGKKSVDDVPIACPPDYHGPQQLINCCLNNPCYAGAQSTLPNAPPPNPTDVAALTTFPFCSCQDYKCVSSPYRLGFGGINYVGVNTNICFTIAYVRGRGIVALYLHVHGPIMSDILPVLWPQVGCDQNNQCCQQITNNLGKIEISVGEEPNSRPSIPIPLSIA